MLDLEKTSPLAFSLTLKDGRKLETVGDAANYLTSLTEEQRERVHWKTAILMELSLNFGDGLAGQAAAVLG